MFDSYLGMFVIEMETFGLISQCVLLIYLSNHKSQIFKIVSQKANDL